MPRPASPAPPWRPAGVSGSTYRARWRGLLLIPALPEFHARYPEIQIDLGVSDRLVDLIDGERRLRHPRRELRDQSLMARRVGDLQLGGLRGTGLLQRAGVPSHPRELEDSHQRIVGFLWARTGKALPLRHAQGEGMPAGGGPSCWRWTTATPTWRPGWPAWASSGCRTTWRAGPRPRRAAAAVRGLEPGADAAVPGVPAEPPRQRQAAGVHQWVAELIARHAPPLHPLPETKTEAYPGKPWSNGKRPGLYICPAIIKMTDTTITRIS